MSPLGLCVQLSLAVLLPSCLGVGVRGTAPAGQDFDSRLMEASS